MTVGMRQFIRWRYTRKSYFKKVFILFLCIFFIFAIIFSTMILKSISDKQTSDISAALYSDMENFVNWSDTRISAAESILASLQTNNDVIKYAITGEYPDLVAIYNMIKGYEPTMGRLGIDIGFLDIERNKSLIVGGVNALDLSKVKLPENMDNTVYNLSDAHELVLVNGTRSGAVFYKQRMYAGNVSLYFFYILYDGFTTNSSMSDDDVGYGLFYKKEMIYSDGEQSFPKEVYENNFGKFEVGGQIGYLRQSVVNQLFTYSCIYSKQPFSKLYLVGILCCLLIFIFAVVLSFLAARYMSRPIQNIINKLQFNGEKGDNYGDWEYISRSIDSIVRNVEVLQEEHEANEKIIMQKVLSDICHGTLSDYQIQGYIKKYQLNILNHPNRIALLRLEDRGNLTSKFGEESIPYLKKDIVDLLQTQMPQFLYFSDSFVSTVLIFRGELDEKICAGMERILDLIWTEFEVSAKIYLGNLSNNYHQLAKRYMELKVIAYDGRARDKGRVIQDLEGSGISGRNSVYYTVDMEAQLTGHLMKGEEQLAEKLVGSILEYNTNGSVSIEILNRLKQCFYVTIVRVLHSIGKTEDEVYGGENLLEPIRNLPDDSKKYFWEMFVPLLRAIPEIRDENGQLYKKIDAFALSHLKDNIGLDDLAEYLNYSSGYTSKLFKSIFGKNFKTYINEYRVSVGKELLKRGYKVVDVANEVGCVHPETFIRIFRKATGISPGEYVKQTQAESEYGDKKASEQNDEKA